MKSKRRCVYISRSHVEKYHSGGTKIYSVVTAPPPLLPPNLKVLRRQKEAAVIATVAFLKNTLDKYLTRSIRAGCGAVTFFTDNFF